MANQDSKCLAEALLISQVTVSCPFSQTGCTAVFNSQDECNRHVMTCFKGALLSCRAPKCTSGRQPLIFSTPRELMDHTVSNHNCLPWINRVTEKIRLTFPDWFLRPKDSQFASLLIRRLVARFDDVEVRLGLMGLVKENPPDGSPTKLYLIPVQMGSIKATNNYLIQMRVQMNGANNVPIPHFGRWNPWEEDEVPQGSVENSSCLLTVNDFKSAIDFHQNFEMHSVASFSRDRILSNGITNPNIDSVSVDVTLRLDIVRCVVQVNTCNSNIREFATSWDEIGARETIRSTVEDPDKKTPSSALRILFPQLIAKRNLLIESLYEFQLMNVIGPFILDSIMIGNTPFNEPTPCKLMVIMPNRTYIEGSIDEWNRWAAIKNFEVYQMVHANAYLIEQFKIHGGHIMLITFAALNHALDTHDERFWTLLTKEIRNIHVHLPSCFPSSLTNDVFRKFVAKLGDRIKIIQRTLFDYHISMVLSDDLFSHMFQGEAMQLSLGENPINFLQRSISIVNCDEGQSKLDLTIRLIQMDGEASKRWIVFVNETSGHMFDALKSGFFMKFPPQRLTFIESEEITRDNPNFFMPFLRSQDGILVAPFSSIAFAEVTAATRVIIFDRPRELADFVQVAAIFKLRKQPLTSIYLISQ